MPSADFASKVAALKAAYGQPSQAAFGSAVFHEQLDATDDLEQKAIAWYQHFLGDSWSATGAAVWMAPWREVYRRASSGPYDTVADLRSITDDVAARSVPMILDVVDDADAARSALAAVFDDATVADLRVYMLGDGAAMSGLLIAAEDRPPTQGVFLVFLLD